MRLMAKVTIPLDAGEEEKGGALPITLRRAIQTLKPESAYFVDEGEKCECFFVFTLDFVTLLQPLFPGLDASFDVKPAMDAAEVERLLGGARGHQPADEDSSLVTDLSPEKRTTPGRHEPGDGQRRVRTGTPLEEAAEQK